MKKAILLFSATLLQFLVGCSEKDLFKKTVEAPSPELATTKSLDVKEVRYEIIPENEPNKYLVRIFWPKTTGKVYVLANFQNLAEFSEETNLFEQSVAGGSVINYELQKSVTSDLNVVLDKRTVNIPLDTVITATASLTADLNLKGGRFFLLNSSLLRTLNYNFSFEGEEFISDDGRIETHPANLKPGYEQSGNSSGNITIHARAASGKLIVFMRGVNGGDGRDSACISSIPMLACNASSGGNGGSTGTFDLSIQENNDFSLSTFNEPGTGGSGGVACKYDERTPIQDSIISGPLTKCAGYGHGRTNGNPGVNGTGKICYKLTKDQSYVCK